MPGSFYRSMEALLFTKRVLEDLKRQEARLLRFTSEFADEGTGVNSQEQVNNNTTGASQAATASMLATYMPNTIPPMAYNAQPIDLQPHDAVPAGHDRWSRIWEEGLFKSVPDWDFFKLDVPECEVPMEYCAIQQDAMSFAEKMDAVVDYCNLPHVSNPMGERRTWTQAEDDMLLALKAEGKTHAEISHEMWRNFGVSRNPNALAKRLEKLNNAVLSRDDAGSCIATVLPSALTMIEQAFSNQLGRQIHPSADDNHKLIRYLTRFYQRQLVLAERRAAGLGIPHVAEQDFGFDADGDFSLDNGPSPID